MHYSLVIHCVGANVHVQLYVPDLSPTSRYTSAAPTPRLTLKVVLQTNTDICRFMCRYSQTRFSLDILVISFDTSRIRQLTLFDRYTFPRSEPSRISMSTR